MPAGAGLAPGAEAAGQGRVETAEAGRQNLKMVYCIVNLLMICNNIVSLTELEISGN